MTLLQEYFNSGIVLSTDLHGYTHANQSNSYLSDFQHITAFCSGLSFSLLAGKINKTAVYTLRRPFLPADCGKKPASTYITDL